MSTWLTYICTSGGSKPLAINSKIDNKMTTTTTTTILAHQANKVSIAQWEAITGVSVAPYRKLPLHIQREQLTTMGVLNGTITEGTLAIDGYLFKTFTYAI